MALVVSMEGRGTMSSMPELDVQPAAARQASNAAKTPDERIPEPVRNTKRADGRCRRNNKALYGRGITKKG
jgi:hypothetical protein